MLELKNLHFSYGAVEALRGVDMRFEPGKVTCIIGRNGVGKTTLMRTIMGIYKNTVGSISLDGTEIDSLPAHRRAKAGLSLVPQGREIFAKLSVEDNLRIGLEADPGGARTIPVHIFDTFPVLNDMRKRMGGDLSGGQQQQLAIGRALAGSPTVMLLDEPTEGIQPNIIQEIGRVLRRLAVEKNMTIILVEQYLDFVKEIGDFFYIMSRGEVVASGPTHELSEELTDQHLTV